LPAIPAEVKRIEAQGKNRTQDLRRQLDRWLADFEKIDIKPEVRPLILKQNATKLLGL
jgi:hypothetical protein